MAATLTVVKGLEPGRVLRLPAEGRFVLGRGATADGRLDEGGVSREHCAVELKDGRARLVDLGSSNGTVLNLERVDERELADGDQIGLGPVALLFRMSAPPRRSTLLGRAASGVVERRYASTTSTAMLSKDFSPDTSRALRMTIDPHRVLEEKDDLTDTPELVRTRQYLNAVCRMASTLPEHVDAEATIDLALDTIFSLTGAENAALLLVDDGEDAPRVVAQRSAAGDGGEFVVSRSVVAETIRQGTSLFTNNAAEDARFGGMSIVAQRIRSIMCAPIRTTHRVVGAVYVDRRVGGAKFRQTDLAVVSALGFQAGVALERARLVEDLQALFVGAMQAIVMSLEARDAYTRGHSERVTLYSLALADRMEWPRERRDVLELAGLMHDIGKIGIPDQVLGKPARLSDDEFNVIAAHPEIGATILGHVPNLERLAPVTDIIAAVRHHHEKFDGTGYPDGLAGEAIPEAAQLLAVADTYDALTTTRPYREGLPRAEAEAILRDCRGKQLNAVLVDAFLSLLDEGVEDRLGAVETRYHRRAP